ncbi:MAG: ABC transporter permease [Dehalococcoidia bacterium]
MTMHSPAADTDAVSRLTTPPAGPLVGTWRMIVKFSQRKPVGAASAGFILLLILMAIFGPLIAPYDPDAGDAARVLMGPNLSYPMGNDQVGRDIFSRILYGARVSLRVSLSAVIFGSMVGTIIGTVSAYFEGWFDAILQRFVDALLAIPLIVIAIMLVSLVAPTLNNLVAALAIVIAPRASRVARGSTLAVKHEMYVEAARSLGATHTRIIARYILPNIFAPLLVLFTVTMGAAITAEASLAFLGLGPSTLISWGRMLSAEGRQYMQVAWWMAVYPGVTIMLAVLAFNMFGDALRDVLDPRLRGSR